MTEQSRHFFWLIMWAIYLFGVYTPSAIRFRKQKVAHEHTRRLDLGLDMATFLGWQVLPLVYIISGWPRFADYHLPAWLGPPGAFLLAAAVAILYSAYRTLGANWSPKIDIREAQQLITYGIFRYMRHPIYAGIWIWALANILLLHNWIVGPAMMLLFTILLTLRLPREEAMLLEHFGERYRDYMAQTGAFFPKRRG